jgi:hypothetical protein
MVEIHYTLADSQPTRREEGTNSKGGLRCVERPEHGAESEGGNRYSWSNSSRLDLSALDFGIFEKFPKLKPPLASSLWCLAASLVFPDQKLFPVYPDVVPNAQMT